jgi:hypothetical protein
LRKGAEECERVVWVEVFMFMPGLLGWRYIPVARQHLEHRFGSHLVLGADLLVWS